MNQDIISFLEGLKEYAQNETGKDKRYRIAAFTKAIKAISEYPKRIESYDEAVRIPGVGKGIGERIAEIISTGNLREVEILNETDGPKNAVLSLFQTIHGVGPVKANEWYGLGYRTLEDIPLERRTNAQHLAIIHGKELAQRIPREDIVFFEEQLKQFLTERGFNIQFEICGSYRRGLPSSGDIDILAVAQPGLDVIQCMISFPLFVSTLSHGEKKYLGIGMIKGIHRRIDIELVQPHEYPFAVVYFTGPYPFNILMREHCAKLGYTLNEKSLTDARGISYFAGSEEHLFSMLGIQYLTPQQREAYSTPK